MMRLRLLLFSCLLTLTACPDSSSTVISKKWTSNIEGIYYGTIASGGVDVPGETHFILDKRDKKLTAKYAFMEEDSKVTGWLDHCQVTEHLSLQCQWHDIYGKGNLSIIFNTEVTEFEGLWNKIDNNNKYHWSGAKAAIDDDEPFAPSD